MISFISGTILASSENYVIIDTGGVGYRVILPERVHGILSKVGTQVKLFIYPNFNPREGSFELYGFENQDELSFFSLLLTVSGVGPKSAQSILSAVDLSTLSLAIVKGDYDYLRKLSGIGPKTSQRIILELKNKLLEKNFGAGADRDLTSEGEAVDALVSLGYTAYHAREAVKAVTAEAKTSEEKIRQALKILAKK
ncbi:MAG: Holliday junction DNA helicase RuvA [Candidatus Yanofskybacteria bacterium RIFCSPHIGHO2_02_FULL_43_15c]|uniref:Holliday junction branch migration complex subunit RuvA n=1 Tax=Candidatus Yanofskybacteria bacterium RIFCSPHIGHO2_02_FULL_43_15c TaxID=1802679 RepID=A0A1F8FLZ4_9BACT|nr:MAG: Holliday junction DNA helicase RuvA [Candidatus Yanofskybacteria bacterium RIFCSPHIGHO2_02_FULL_43_15c]OGY66451.1 MAG: Holliday junction DNA helicase RuvA [Candidatus Harrisonbacteria bacterium RIFCSPLOWO2_02_FULL_41_11]